MLKIWTAADADIIGKTIGVSLKSFRPKVPPNEFIVFDPEAEVVKPVPGEVCLVCGVKPLAVLQAAKLAPKNRTVSSLRETILPAPSGGSYMVTFDPNVIHSEPPKKEVIDWDLRLAVRLLTTGSLKPPLGEYEWVNDFQPMIDQIEKKAAKTGKAVHVTMDTETMTTNPWDPNNDIISISFTMEPGRSKLLYTGPTKPPKPLDPSIPLLDQIRWFLTSKSVKLRMANGKFDLIWIAEKWGIACTNFKFDTLLVGSLLDENRSNSLNLHAKIFTKFGGYDDSLNSKYDKGKMELVPLDELLPYAGGDTDAAHQVADLMFDQLMSDPPMANLYVKVLHPAARAFEKIERRGVLVDQQKYAALRDELQGVIKTSEQTALSLLSRKMRFKYRDEIEDQFKHGKNPLLPKILKAYFFTPYGLNLKPKMVTPKTGEPSMKKEHLKQFLNVPEAKAMVEVLTSLDVAAKTLSTFVDGFLKHLRPDGRFHPSYMLFHGGFNDDEDDESGTVTGRLSAKEPAFQTLMKKSVWAKKLRACFPAPPGRVVLSSDFNQGELRVIACVAPEPTMIASYLQGLDLHAVTGAKLGGVDLKEFLSWGLSKDSLLKDLYAKYRGNAKAINFGLTYGMSSEGFRAYAYAKYDLVLTSEEATTMRDAFFELYPGLLEYHDKMREVVKFTEAVRSPIGRVRHLPIIRSWDRQVRSKAERMAVNSPIQSTLSDMMLYAIALIENAYPNGEIEVVGMVHDSLVAYIPEHDAAMWARRVVEIMSNLPLKELGWNPPLQFTADAEFGPDLATLEKLKIAV